MTSDKPEDQKADGQGEPEGNMPEREEEEKKRVQDEIEEILRQKGEAPGRARHPQYPTLQPLPPAVANLFKYLLIAAIGAVLLFLSVRVLGPRGLVFTFWALFLFFFFYAVRGVLQDVLRRRPR